MDRGKHVNKEENSKTRLVVGMKKFRGILIAAAILIGLGGMGITSKAWDKTYEKTIVTKNADGTWNSPSDYIDDIYYDYYQLWGYYNLEHYNLIIDPNGGLNLLYDKIVVTQYCTYGKLPGERDTVGTGVGSDINDQITGCIGVIRKGYHLKGWSLEDPKKVANPKLIDKDDWVNEEGWTNPDLKWADNSNHTIYAVWEPVTDGSHQYAGILDKNGNLLADFSEPAYTITYVLNGGANASNNPASYTSKDKTITLKKPTRKGYTFKGWYTDSNFKKKITQIPSGSASNYTLYAKWEKVRVKKPTKVQVSNQEGKKAGITFKKVSGAKGYELQYSTSKKFKKNVKSKTISKDSYTIKKLKKGKTYYIRIRAYKKDSAGDKVYSKWSLVKKVKIKK